MFDLKVMSNMHKNCAAYLDSEENEDLRISPARYKGVQLFAFTLAKEILNLALSQSSSMDWNIHCSGKCNQKLCQEEYKRSLSWDYREKASKTMFSSMSDGGTSVCWTPELPYGSSQKPYIKASRRSSLSISHDSLTGINTNFDDSHMISGAVSHDTLVFSNDKESFSTTNEPSRAIFDNDIYSLPLDVVQPYNGTVIQPKVVIKQPKNIYPNCFVRANGNGQLKIDLPSNSNDCESTIDFSCRNKHDSFEFVTGVDDKSNVKTTETVSNTEHSKIKCSLITTQTEFNEIKCKASSKRIGRLIPFSCTKSSKKVDVPSSKEKHNKFRCFSGNIRNSLCTIFTTKKVYKENTEDFVNAENEFITKSFENSDEVNAQNWGKFCPLSSAPPLKNPISTNNSAFSHHVKKSDLNGLKKNDYRKDNFVNKQTSRTFNDEVFNSKPANSFRSTSLLSCIRHSRNDSVDEQITLKNNQGEVCLESFTLSPSNISPSENNKRALPPLPKQMEKKEDARNVEFIRAAKLKLDEGCDFASIIDKVKDYGWYWGPISGEAAEKVLSNEPDGSFIVRDSSDHHYIFSLTFRLNGITRHVRIEHDQGNFSFGGITRFKSQTIVDFIEKAVEHSRSGRYLFFLHRRPVLGPMRVQLLHPVSRFKHVQSLQHLCRFTIVKRVRRDYLLNLPLPQRLKDYLNSPHYYSEQVEQCMSSSKNSSNDSVTEKVVRSQNLHTRYTPQPPRSSCRTEFLSLGYRANNRNLPSYNHPQSGATGIPRSVNYNFSCDPPAPLHAVSRRRRKTRTKFSDELRRSSSQSSIDSLVFTAAGVSDEQNSGYRRVSFHSMRMFNFPETVSSSPIVTEQFDGDSSSAVSLNHNSSTSNL